jgi:hypothetical protein
MKFAQWCFLLGLSIQSTQLFADAENNDALLPQVKVEFNHIQSSRFKHHRHRDRLSFANASVMATYTQQLNQMSGLQYGLGYDNTRYNFHKKPHIIQKSFDNLLLNLGGYMLSSENLLWNADVLAHINTEHLNPIHYTLYEGLFQGIYSWKEKTKLIFGAYAAGGMNYFSVLPVVGINYDATKRLTFSAGFPLNVQANFAITENVSLNGTIKQFFSRQKLGINEPSRHRKGIIGYTNTGAEVGIAFNIAKKISANIHVGEAFGSHVSISKRNGHRTQHLKQESSPYFGFAATILF